MKIKDPSSIGVFVFVYGTGLITKALKPFMFDNYVILFWFLVAMLVQTGTKFFGNPQVQRTQLAHMNIELDKPQL